MANTLIPFARLADDQKIVAERAWRAPSRARTAQAPCDVGLFGDDARQTDLLDALTHKQEE